MKIGILTIQNVNNYGAELQSCALCLKLQKLGYDAENINYLFGIHPRHDFKGEHLSVPIPFKQRIKVKLLPIVQELFCAFSQKDKAIRNKRFDDFHAEHNHLTTAVYPSVKSLYEADFDYDVLCIGSDQVWNYQKGYSLEPYLACFDQKGAKKISYGSSIGLSSISKEAEDLFKKELPKFSSLSVREQQAAGLLQNLLKKDVEVVVDPTLLLNKEEWLGVAKFDMCPKEKYVLVYIVTIKPCDYVLEVARKIAKERGLKIVRICRDAYPERSGRDVTEITTAGPSDFVGLFANAEFVVTNSFHGTVFSVNFSKPFYSVIKRTNTTNSRLISILGKLKLDDRILPVGATIPEVTDIDFAEPSELLEKEKMRSVEYLRKALD